LRLPLLPLFCLAAGSLALHADPIPYGNAGSISGATATYATSTSIEAYFYSESAGDTDIVSVWDINTQSFLSPGGVLNNQTTPIGTPVIFTGVNPGDQIVFVLTNEQIEGSFLTSDADLSSDGINHAYITDFSGSIPGDGTITGLYVGMEDLPFTPKGDTTDLDYNDDTFVFQNVSATAPAPEPGTLVLLGTGLLGAAGAIRRRLTA
jgi:hypothetical protein